MGKKKERPVIQPKSVDEIKAEKEAKAAKEKEARKKANEDIKKPDLPENTTVLKIIGSADEKIDNNKAEENSVEAAAKHTQVNNKKRSMVNIKKMIIGNKEITAEYHSKEKKRPNYYISAETVEIVDEISELLGYPKSEFVDVYLKHGLTKVLKDLKK